MGIRQSFAWQKRQDGTFFGSSDGYYSPPPAHNGQALWNTHGANLLLMQVIKIRTPYPWICCKSDEWLNRLWGMIMCQTSNRHAFCVLHWMKWKDDRCSNYNLAFYTFCILFLLQFIHGLHTWMCASQGRCSVVVFCLSKKKEVARQDSCQTKKIPKNVHWTSCLFESLVLTDDCIKMTS